MTGEQFQQAVRRDVPLLTPGAAFTLTTNGDHGGGRIRMIKPGEMDHVAPLGEIRR